jgi:hypothetical protein
MDREVADFWDTHSAADYWDELSPVSTEERPAAREVVTLRLDPKAARALRAVARRRGVSYTALAREWISERLRKELG